MALTKTHRSLLLYVEDDNSDALLVTRAFNKVAPEIVISRLADGDDAVSYLSGEGDYADRAKNPLPVAVLLDLKLPRRSGFEVLDWIRLQSQRFRLLPVIVFSSSALQDDIRRAYASGANSYLVKPDSAGDLHDLISYFREYWFALNEPPPF